MNDIDQIVRRLRHMASELVRAGRPSDAAAVLAGIGALELLELFSQRGDHTGAGAQSSSSAGEHHNASVSSGGEQYGG